MLADTTTFNVEDLKGATASFKVQNAALLAQLMPQDDVLDMPAQQASFHCQMCYTVPAPKGPSATCPELAHMSGSLLQPQF